MGNGFYGHDKYWNEHQEIPLGYIADYIRRVDEGQEIMRPVEALIAERDRIIEEYRDLLEGENQALFDAKRGLAATAYPYVENHNFYIEHWTMGVFWRKIRELSRMMHAEGFWTEPDDLLYLGRNEVRDALFDLSPAGASGAKPIGPDYWPEEIERRRGIVDALKTARPAPALNTPPESITEPFTRMLWGITTEQVQQWLGAGEAVEGGGLRGMAASPGVVEGLARVVHDADQLSEVQQGEILVATVTAPSWGPIFGKIKATVTDIGGMMSHAAIVCREYGLPAVTGTGSASTTIKTGQRLRVDGDQGHGPDPRRRGRAAGDRPRRPQPQPCLRSHCARNRASRRAAPSSITGAAGGLGRAFALGFAGRGYRVAVADINLEGAERDREAGPRTRRRSRRLLAPMSPVVDSTEALAKSCADFGNGSIDVVLNNAAVYAGVTRSPFEDIDPAEWDLVMNVNLKGPWLVTRAASPYLPEGGRVINLSSATIFSGSEQWLHYVASKGGVVALTRVMAKELGRRGITVNAIAPGFTLTEASYGLMENAENYGVDRGAIKRASQPEDIVGAALFLAGPDSSYYTGQTMVVDGGRQFI